MLNERRVIELVRQADPVTDVDDLPVPRLDAATLLSRIEPVEGRSGNPWPPSVEAGDRRSARTWLPYAVGAAAAALIVVVIAVVVFGDSEQTSEVDVVDTPEVDLPAGPTVEPIPAEGEGSTPEPTPTVVPDPTVPQGQLELSTAVVGSTEGRFRSLTWVTVDLNDADLPFVAFFVFETSSWSFVQCEDPACATTSDTYELTNVGLPASVGRSPGGMPVVGLGPSSPSGPDGEIWMSILACEDPTCFDYHETRVDDVAFYAMHVAEDGTTVAIANGLDYDSNGSQDGFEMIVCTDPSCAGGPTRIDVDGWTHTGAPHQLAIVNDNPVVSYLSGFSSSGQASSVDVVRCLDALCSTIESATIEGGVEHALAAGPDGPVALLTDVVRPGSGEGSGIMLHVWDNDLSESVVIELDDPARADQVVFIGDRSVEVDDDGRPVAVWFRDIFNGPPEDAPADATRWLGTYLTGLEDLTPEDLDARGITLREGVLVGDPFPGADPSDLLPGDVITTFDDAPVASWADIDSLLANTTPGDTARIGYDRSGSHRITEVTVAAMFSELMLARCDDRSCTSGTIATLAQAPLKALHGWPAVTIDSDGYPVVAYWVRDDVTVARCTDPGCVEGALVVDSW